MRPLKERHVEQLPPVAQFKPVGVPIFAVDEMVVSIEEMEAIRLADLEGLDQGPASELMGISRPTFHRILTKAHLKMAQFIWQGKSLRIEGGNYRMKCCPSGLRKFSCMGCGFDWEIPHGQGGRGCEMICPQCGASTLTRLR